MSTYMQSIFWSRILKELHKHKILIDIDESSFTRSVKMMYSWLPSGKSSPILNINWKGRSSVIFGLISKSFWIWLIHDGTGTIKAFCFFLMILKQYVESIFENEVLEFWIMLDNAAIHWAEATRRIAALYNFQMNYLPPYWPHLAPVEVVFGIAKKNLISLKLEVQVNFSKAEGKKIIADSFRAIESSTMSGLWKRFLRTPKQLLRQFNGWLEIILKDWLD